MINEIKKIIVISRPRFWLYEAGTFFVGAIISINNIKEFISFDFLFYLLYFIFPANLLIYGINDIFDYETDMLNPKKQNYEFFLKKEEHKKFYFYITIINLPFLIISIFYLGNKSLIYLILFLFFAIFYSAKPIRAKTKPILDSLFSASHYIFTGIFGYSLFGPTKDFPYLGFIAGILWAFAMHAYSAIPDIESDKKANMQTIATFLGDKITTILCGTFYSLSAILFYKLIGIYSIICGIIYISIIIYTFINLKNYDKIFKAYKIFPYINTFIPMIWSIKFLSEKFIFI